MPTDSNVPSLVPKATVDYYMGGWLQECGVSWVVPLERDTPQRFLVHHGTNVYLRQSGRRHEADMVIQKWQAAASEVPPVAQHARLQQTRTKRIIGHRG